MDERDGFERRLREARTRQGLDKPTGNDRAGLPTGPWGIGFRAGVEVVSALVVGIVDSSKFGTMSFSAFALPHEISQIITDTGALPSMVAELRERGITVTVV